MKPRPVDTGWAWVICFSGFWCVLMVGLALQCHSVLLLDFVTAFDSTVTKASLALMCNNIGMTLSALVSTNVLVPTYGVRVVVMTSGCMMGVCFMSYSVLASIEEFIVMCTLHGCFHGCLFIPALTLHGFYFDKCCATASTIVTSGISVAVLVFPKMIREIVTEFGLKHGVVMLGAIQLQIVLCGVVMTPPSNYGPPETTVLESFTVPDVTSLKGSEEDIPESEADKDGTKPQLRRKPSPPRRIIQQPIPDVPNFTCMEMDCGSSVSYETYSRGRSSQYSSSPHRSTTTVGHQSNFSRWTRRSSKSWGTGQKSIFSRYSYSSGGASQYYTTTEVTSSFRPPIDHQPLPVIVANSTSDDHFSNISDEGLRELGVQETKSDECNTIIYGSPSLQDTRAVSGLSLLSNTIHLSSIWYHFFGFTPKSAQSEAGTTSPSVTSSKLSDLHDATNMSMLSWKGSDISHIVSTMNNTGVNTTPQGSQVAVLEEVKGEDVVVVDTDIDTDSERRRGCVWCGWCGCGRTESTKAGTPDKSSQSASVENTSTVSESQTKRNKLRFTSKVHVHEFKFDDESSGQTQRRGCCLCVSTQKSTSSECDEQSITSDRICKTTVIKTKPLEDSTHIDGILEDSENNTGILEDSTNNAGIFDSLTSVSGPKEDPEIQCIEPSSSSSIHLPRPESRSRSFSSRSSSIVTVVQFSRTKKLAADSRLDNTGLTNSGLTNSEPTNSGLSKHNVYEPTTTSSELTTKDVVTVVTSSSHSHSCWKDVFHCRIFLQMFHADFYRLWSYRVWMISNVLGASNQLIYTYLVTISVKKGVSKEEGARLLTVLGAVNLVSRGLLCFISDRRCITTAGVIAISQICLGIVCPIGIMFDDYNALTVWAALTGLFIGVRFCLHSVLLIELVGVENLGKSLSSSSFVTSISGAIQQPLINLLGEIQGTYNWVIGFFAVTLIINGLMVSQLPRIARTCDAQSDVQNDVQKDLQKDVPEASNGES